MSRLNVAFLRALDTNADPVSGGKRYVFLAGTTTPATTYSDSGLTNAQAHPLISDAAGNFANSYAADGVSYKVRVTDAADVTLYEADDVAVASPATDARYNSATAMKTDSNLLVGDVVRTSGYENPGDGGDGTYEIVAAGTGTADGGAFIELTGISGQAKLLHGGALRAEQYGVVLDNSGNAQEKSAEFNAAFAFACSIQPDTFADGAIDTAGINEFSCHTDFMAKDTLQLHNANKTADTMMITWGGHVKAVTGGELATHTQERPIPLILGKLRNCSVKWPRLECQNLCAGIKMKKDIGSNHTGLDMRGYSRYGLWRVEGNDSIWRSYIIKQFSHESTTVINGVDPTDWANWNGDAVVVTTKDHQFIGGQVGWGGPCYRFTDDMPDDTAQRIPGQNCYWCGLEAGQGYVDGNNGGGDVTVTAGHMMQAISIDSALDIATGPRTGAYADYDLTTGNLVIRETDTPIGVLSFCKVSNLSYFDRVDNDMCNHLLFGAQVEFTGEMPGSAPLVKASRDNENIILDPRVRVFASRGSGGSQRYPFMASMDRQRDMTIAFYDNPAEIYWNGSALVEAASSWNGDFEEWNRLNRASGSYSGQIQWKGTLDAGTHTPAVTAAGDQWLSLGATTVNPGGVTAADGQLVIALTASPAGSGDWLVVDADSAPIRDTTRREASALPHQFNMYVEKNVPGVSQMNQFTGDDRLAESWHTGNSDKTTRSFEGGVILQSGAEAVVLDAPTFFGMPATRSALVALIASKGSQIANNTVVFVGDIGWKKVTGATEIADMPDFESFGDPTPNHYKENTTPGTTDMAGAIVAAAHRNGTTGSSSSPGHTVRFLAEKYAHSAIAITRDAVRLKGDGRQSTQLLCLDATGDGVTLGHATSKIFRPGLEDLTLGMASGVEKTSGAHLRVLRGRGAGINRVDVEDFFDGIILEGTDRFNAYDVTGTNLNRTLKCGKFISELYYAAETEKCTRNKFVMVSAAASAVLGDAGMYIESSDGAHIAECNFNQFDHAMHIHSDSTKPSIGGIMVANTYFDESGVNNLLIDGDGNVNNSKFGISYFRKAGESSIKVGASVSIDGFVMEGSSCETAEEMAIEWLSEDSTGVVITGHLFDDNLRDDTTTTEVLYNGDNLTLATSAFKGGWAGGTCITLGANSSDCQIGVSNYAASVNGTNVTDNGTGNNVIQLAAFVADAATGSAAEINAIRDALITAGLMAAS